MTVAGGGFMGKSAPAQWKSSNNWEGWVFKELRAYVGRQAYHQPSGTGLILKKNKIQDMGQLGLLG